jgi:hypothetical protein
MLRRLVLRPLQHSARLAPLKLNSLTHARRSSGFTNILASEIPPPVQVQSMTDAGIILSDGLIISGPCIFLEGKVFLWDVPSTLWDGWGKERFEIFDVVVPKPGEDPLPLVEVYKLINSSWFRDITSWNWETRLEASSASSFASESARDAGRCHGHSSFYNFLLSYFLKFMGNNVLAKRMLHVQLARRRRSPRRCRSITILTPPMEEVSFRANNDRILIRNSCLRGAAHLLQSLRPEYARTKGGNGGINRIRIHLNYF